MDPQKGMEKSLGKGVPEKVGRDTVKVVISQLIGFTLDGYDLSIILTIGPLLAAAVLPPASPLIQALSVILSYSFTIIFRPLGSAVFGHLGDKIGRRNDLIITVIGLGVTSALTAALPTYSQVGILSYVLFTILRAGVGFFAGGEYAAGHPFAMEWTPYKWRGLVSGLIQGGFPLGVALVTGVQTLFISIYGLDALKAYAWRYLFLTTIIPAVIALAVRLTMEESPVFQDVKKRNLVRKTPFFDLFKKPYRRDFFQVMLMMTGLFFTAYVWFSFVPPILQNPPSHIPLGNITFILTIDNLAIFVFYILFSALTQYVGRRRLLIIWNAVAVILSVPLYYGLIQAASAGNQLLVGIIGALIGLTLVTPWGVIPIYLSERFKASMRSSGLGFGYSSGILLGGWFSIYVGLMHQYLFGSIDGPTNLWFSTAVLGIIGGALVALGAYLGPETLGTRLTEE
jgi:MHS family proline/betaine transporter-like MFS transporter